MKFDKWIEVGAGLLLATGTVASPIPGDEFLGVPLGLGLIAHGFGYLK